MLCLIDECGDYCLKSPEPLRLGFLLTCWPERLESDIARLKKELSPRGRSGEYHSSEEHPDTRSKLRALLCLNNEPRMYIVEWDKQGFSADFFVNGRLTVCQDTNPLIASFAITASEIAAAASASGRNIVDIVSEAKNVDIRSEHRSREQAFRQVLKAAFEEQVPTKRPPPGTTTIIRVSTRRKYQYPPLSFVDYWLWAYRRHSDCGDKEVLPDSLKSRTTVRRMTENDVKRHPSGDR